MSIIVGFVLVATCYDILDKILDFIHSKTDEEPYDVTQSKTAIAGENVVGSRVKEVKKRTKFGQFLIDCSIYTNTEKFFRTDNGGSVTCLNGIRLFSMVWIVWGHTYNYVADRSKFFLLGIHSYSVYFNQNENLSISFY